MLRVGIITMYFNSKNYGGLLQSYALVRFLEKNNIYAEQICYMRDDVYCLSSKINVLIYRLFKDFVNGTLHNFQIKKQIKKRNKKFLIFEKSVPHSKEVYHDSDLSVLDKKYNILCTGSDQVWANYVKGYFLDFKTKAKKISYAASISRDSIDEKQKSIFKSCLAEYFSISVRENKAIDILKDCTNKIISKVLDPTLLLEKEDWDALEDKINELPDNYLFCYFLGDDEKIRKLAVEFAKSKSLKIVTIPHLLGRINRIDLKFGDIQIIDASVGNFISLIKNATYIFTDSFHASVFSSIYQKNYFVFQRKEAPQMTSRIYDITTMFKSNASFVDSSEKMDMLYLTNNCKTNYDFSKYQVEKQKSINFLLTAIHE